MFKKLFSLFLAAVILVQPLAAQASDLGAAFTNLLGGGSAVSVNKPGHYQSGARNSFSSGGIEIRAPRQGSVPQLFSYTPPSISAGCGGISATFGGFSFISGEEFEQMLKSLASGAALGFVSMMAIKALCPTCEAVIQFLKTAAQVAAKLAKEACRFGQQLGAAFFGGGDAGGSRAVDYCSATSIRENATNDYLGLAQAIGGACETMKSAVDTLLGGSAADDPEKFKEMACKIGEIGNVTWTRLGVFEAGYDQDAYRRKLLWMNLMGIEMGYSGEKKSVSCQSDEGGTEGGFITPDAEKGDGKIYCPPRLDPKDAMLLFMCGIPDDNGAPMGIPAGDDSASYAEVIKYCSSFFKSAQAAALNTTRVYYCSEGSIEKGECLNVKLGGLDKLVLSNGFLVQVYTALFKGVLAVRMNEEMPVDTIKLMQIAPFPLYQAINAAAVYPSMAQNLISGMGTMVAEQIAIGHLDQMLRMTGQMTPGKRSCLSPAQASRLLDAMSTMRTEAGKVTANLAASITIQETITQQIRQVNQSIQRQVLTQDMLATQQYSESIKGAVSSVLPHSPVGPTAPTTP